MWGGAAAVHVARGGAKAWPVTPLSKHIATCIIVTLDAYKATLNPSHRVEVNTFLAANPMPTFKNLEDFILALPTPLKPNRALHSALTHDLAENFDMYSYEATADKEIKAGIAQIKSACKVPIKINMEQQIADCIIKVLENYKKHLFATHSKQVDTFLVANRKPSFANLMHFILSLTTALKPEMALHTALVVHLEAELKAYYDDWMPEEISEGIAQIKNACAATSEIHKLYFRSAPTTLWSFFSWGPPTIYAVGKDFPEERAKILAEHNLTPVAIAAKEARESWEGVKAAAGAGAGAVPR